MKITGTFLNSKVAQRIAILLFIAAVIPTLLMTALSSNKVNQVVTKYEHKLLLEKNRGYALQAFSNLVYARNYIANSSLQQLSQNINDISVERAKHTVPMFADMVIVAAGALNDPDAASALGVSTEELSSLASFNRNKIALLVGKHSAKPASTRPVYLAMYQGHHTQPYYIISQLSAQYLWGNKAEYPADLQVCAYTLLSHGNKQPIFCSSDAVAANRSSETAADNINHARWELFLNGEFNSEPWIFEVERTQALTSNHLKEFVGSSAYISIAIGSLLAVGLLSLIQIRKTMVPLEKLMDGTEQIKAGNFSAVEVKDNSEFSVLANAFNGMSSHIKKQFETMRSYSTIDREIVSNNDVHHVIQLVLDRMQTLAPEHAYCIARVKEQSDYETQCNCTLVMDKTPLGVRLAVPNQELGAIKQHQQGVFKAVTMESQYAHERLMAEFGAKQLWSLPIFWQGDIYGFICIGSQNPFIEEDSYWHEIQELANRIGTAIASSVREQQLLLEAQYDNLTGLPNRILLRDRLKLAMEHSDKTGKAMWVVFIDLDRFKVINDSMGHATGDTLLKEIAQRLLAQTRDTDTVARFGGDEFVLVLSGDAGESIQISVLQRMMEAIAQPITIDNHELVTTCSIGIAVYPEDGKNAEVLIKNADIAMYRAKELGRNNYQFFTQTLNDKAAKRMQMISLLRKAIENEEFHLVYQPKVDIASGNIVGLEALIRWDQPQLGPVSPAEFIPVAEEAGLINAIGIWSLEKASQQAAIWYQSGYRILTSVNISAKQFEQTDIVDTLQSILIKTGTKASCLELELTETALVNISDQTIKTLHDIKALGVELSIDDFGTGYSNLSYLNSLPMNTLKIDKSFVDTITLKTDKSPIVDTIISLGQNLGLKVVAEGVETAEQVAYLKARACDQIQGYFFSKPASAEEITSMLFSRRSLSSSQKLSLVKKAKG